jgi:TolA-binding protein
MTKKILFTSLILFGFALFGIAEVFFADVSADLEQAKLNVISLIQGGNYAEAEVQTQKLLADFSEHKDIAKAVCQIADEFYKNNKFEQARYLFQYLVDKYPSSEYAMWGQCGVTNSSIRLGEDSTAQTAIDKLIANYSAHKEIASAVCFVADNYRELQKDEKANQVYQRILDKWPESEYTMWSQMHLAMSNIRDGDDAAVQAAIDAIDKLIANYTGQKDIAKAVCQVADQYYQLQRHQQADRLYHKVVESCPKGEYSMWSQMHIAMSNIRNGNYAAADIEVDKLLAGYPKEEFMALAVFQIADKYCDTNQYEKANQLYQYVIDNWSEDVNAMRVQSYIIRANIALGNIQLAEAAAEKMIADYRNDDNIADAVYEEIAYCYYKFGKYEKAIQYFQKIVNDWPDYKYAWNVQCWIGECYWKLKESGALPQSEVNPQIKLAYQTLIEKYPDCSLAGHACLKLAHLSSEEGRQVDAAMYLEMFLQNSPDDPRVPDILYDLGQAYEKMGRLDSAVEVYAEFIEADPNSPLVKALQKKFEELGGQNR